MRRKLVAANWKLNGSLAANAAWLEGFMPRVKDVNCDVAVAAPSVYLTQLAAGFAGSAVIPAAEDVSLYDAGAYTGEVAAAMLRDVGVKAVIVGHSERRALFHETDAVVAKKVQAAIAAGLTVILCVGETRGVREGGLAERFVATQLKDSLAGVTADAADRLVVAYEPVWAIGTGLTATPDVAQAMHSTIRGTFASLFGDAKAATLRVLYGGSVKPANAAALFAEPDIDGALVGGASLKVDDFYEICRAAAQTTTGK